MEQLDMTDLGDRIRAVIACSIPTQDRYASLAEQSGLSRMVWRSFWYGQQPPTDEMFSFVFTRWPQYAFWMATGWTDQANGHRCPEGVVPLGEFKPNMAASAA
ncbi:MAG: hypothetical protein ACK4K3_02010 [Aquabacterium sp.]